MEEKETKETKEKKIEDNTHQKAYWIVGISLIIFLILLFGSLIGFNIIRNRIQDFSLGNGRRGGTNYEVSDDGLMKNISKGLAETEINVENIVFSGFTITERNTDSGETETIIDSDIRFTIENKSEEDIKDAGSYSVALYDSSNSKLTQFTIKLDTLPSKKEVMFRQNLNMSCVNADRVEISKIN